MKVYRISESAPTGVEEVFDIMEATYTGQDMGKRCITATIKYATPIDFRLGDYVEIPMQTLVRNGNRGTILTEKFYIYHEPQCKKTARPMSAGDAFETTVTFYPRQYELAGIQMRDFIQQEANADKIIYTGFENVSFYGGAHELLERCMACLAQHYHDDQGNPLWSYVLADAVNEDKNNALERYAFTFSGNSVMEAITKLNDKDGINTTFFINERTIYVGFKRPFLCKTDASGNVQDVPLNMTYGKTSHLSLDKNYGGLYDITKTVGEELPITKLFAYGAARNLNRYYCSDRIKSGRYVNKLMLPSFSDDGTTDWIISEDGVKKYGVREGSKTFEEIYPSLRYMTYADIRGVKYCIKVKTSGLESDKFIDGKMEHTNDEGRAKRPLARVQCYKVTPCTGDKVGHNTLVECAPPEDLAVFIHATGKTVKVLLCGGDNALERQLEHDFNHVPTRTLNGTDYIPGSCFAVHDVGFDDMDGTTHTQEDRQAWFNAEFRRFSDTDSIYPENIEQQEAELHRIEYVDTFWMTDLYVMGYDTYGHALYDDQRYFKRDGYSAWAWPRLNNESNYPDSLPVNEVVAVEPVVIADTSENADGGRQQHFDIYLRDLGFAIDEQNDFGEMVFVFQTPTISVLDGVLEGRSFTIDGGDNLNDYQDRIVCAYKEDGSFNDEFLYPGDSKDEGVIKKALQDGAVWRIRLNRNDQDSELSSIGLVIPNVDIQMKAGDHIVLLDIYMPDIYIKAAENRLLKEARAYLENNDKSNVKYAINFDKVRFNQIPNYAKQMREGVVLRMYDEDLNITSENKVREIVNHNVPALFNVPLYKNTQPTTEYIDTEQKYWFTNQQVKISNLNKLPISSYNEQTQVMHIQVPRSDAYALFQTGSLKFNFGVYGQDFVPSGQSAYSIEDRWSIAFTCDADLYRKIYESRKYYVQITESIPETIISKEYYDGGDKVPAICKEYVTFKSGKYYEIVMDVEADRWIGSDKIVLSVSPDDTTTCYTIQDYTCEVEDPVDGYKRVTYKFFLPDSFNDAQGYYVALEYIAPYNESESGEESDDAEMVDFAFIKMVSVTEKDLDEDGNVVKYADFVVSNVTVKITDNTRDGAGIQTVPIREITAQIEEQTKASTWGALMNNVSKTKIEAEQNKRTYEMLAQSARQNYQRLLDLKNSIFDPDGSCTNLFVQTMMLQVGADSMNYQLEQTFTTADGTMNNFAVRRKTVSGNMFFMVFNDDMLHHFVYTQGAGNAGNWVIPGNFEAELAPNTSSGETVWPVYYVALKCSRDEENNLSNPAWICDTQQHAVNEDENYWYFNWGILTPDSNGNYTFTETRGNAYMYGDNIVAGKINTIAGNSYFDLTHGNFVLSQSGADAQGNYHDGMTYINGVLTIYGSNGEDRLANFDSRMDNIQSQVDGNITSWFCSGVPTLENAPASEWTTVEDKDKHLGDLYYDNNTGYCYRFLVENNVYKWEKIVDNDVVLALRNVDDVTNDCIISKGSEKINLKKEWLEVAGQNLNGTTDGTYYKATTEAQKYKLSYGNSSSGLMGAFTLLKGYMDALLANVGANSYLSDYSGTLPEGVTKLSFSHTQLNNAWKNYYTEEAALNNRIALVGSGNVNLFPKKFMDDWNTARPTNLFSKATFTKSGCDVFQDKSLMCSTRTTNTSATPNYFAVRRMIDSTHVYPTSGEARFVYMNAIGQFSGQFAKDSNWHYLQVYFNGNNANASMLINADALFENGKTYMITGRVSILDRSGSGNHAQLEELYIYEGTEAYYLNEYIGYRAVDNNYGEYFAVHEHRLFSIIGGGGTARNPVIPVSFEAGKQYTLKVKWSHPNTKSNTTLWLGFKYADSTSDYNTYDWVKCPASQATPIIQTLVSDASRTVIGLCATYGDVTDDTRIYEISLTEGAYPPIGWIEAEEDKVQGGETLANYATADVNNMTKVGESGFRQVLADTKSELALTIDDYETGRIPSNNINTYVSNASVKLGRQAFSFIIRRATKVLRIKHNGSQHDAISTFTLDEPLAKGTRVVVSLEFVNISQGSFEWKDVMIQVGNKATDYQRYYQYLAQAFENEARSNRTEVNGGLMATSLIKLRYKSGENVDGTPQYTVTAGMSGLDDKGKKIQNNQLVPDSNSHGVTLWGGGTFEQALQAAAGNGTMPVLLTKTGINSMIGCFRVVDEDTIAVKTTASEIFITNKSIEDKANIEDTHKGTGLSAGYSISQGSDPISGSIFSSKSFSDIEGGKYKVTVPALSIRMQASSDTTQRDSYTANVSVDYELRIEIVHSNGNILYSGDYVRDEAESRCYQPNQTGATTDRTKTIPAVNIPSLEIPAGTITIRLSGSYHVSVVGEGNYHGAASISIASGVQMSIANLAKYVVVARDGMAIIANSDSAFYVKNNETTGSLKLIAKGLPQQTSDSGLSFGQLYNSNGTLKVSMNESQS